MMGAIAWAERGMVPDVITRWGIRRLLGKRLADERSATGDQGDRLTRFTDACRDAAVAVHTADANHQHYEVPTEFFRTVLGPHMKYSCALFPDADTALDRAESLMLGLTCERAGIGRDMDILELGCGWGSLTLFMAGRFPDARITAVSNSATQKQHIDAQAAARGLRNVRVITADMNEFTTDRRFDRVVSVEMFEHMRNHPLLLNRIHSWLNRNGRLFFHIFCHRDLAYRFETEADDDWMGRHFFTGGIMPAWDLPLHWQQDFELVNRWQVSGRHYARTCEAWLMRLDGHREQALAALGRGRNPDPPALQLQRWRIFFMACAELFAYGNGGEWFVGHYLMQPRAAA